MSSTTASTEKQCNQCKSFISGFFGAKVGWTYINGIGPFCDECRKHGIKVVVEVTT